MQGCRMPLQITGFVREPRLMGVHQLRDVVGSPGFRSWPEAARLTPTKWLPQHNGACNGSVDVEIARLDVVYPIIDFACVQGLQPGRKAVGAFVGNFNGL